MFNLHKINITDAFEAKSDVNSNIQHINIDTVSKIQKELVSYDVISLVFLLYDVSETALQRLIVYQRILDSETDLITQWALHEQSQNKPWKYNLIEALAICQLYGIIRKLGFNVAMVKNHLMPDNIHVSLYINPFKKTFYKICEYTDMDTFKKIKRTLHSHDINVDGYESMEMVILEMLSHNHIKIKQSQCNDRITVEFLINILEKFPSLRNFALTLKELEGTIMKSKNYASVENTDTSTPLNVKQNSEKAKTSSADGFNEISNLLKSLDLEDLHSDTHKEVNYNEDDIYKIKNKSRLGICYIINQEKFHSSKRATECDETVTLQDRAGSHKDVGVLTTTMSKLNFKVICHNNLEAGHILRNLKDVVQYDVHESDSVFILCILSHGIRGYVYGADSLKVNVDDIQKSLDLNKALHDIPKIIIIQACQVEEDNIVNRVIENLHVDSPIDKFHVKKSDMLIYWATAPEFEAYRYKNMGSIFIHMLCKVINEYAEQEQFTDMCTRVNKKLKEICQKLKINQPPEYKSLLTKKLFFKLPH